LVCGRFAPSKVQVGFTAARSRRFAARPQLAPPSGPPPPPGPPWGRPNQARDLSFLLAKHPQECRLANGRQWLQIRRAFLRLALPIAKRLAYQRIHIGLPGLSQSLPVAR
jgi:hypothetical protein